MTNSFRKWRGFQKRAVILFAATVTASLAAGGSYTFALYNIGLPDVENTTALGVSANGQFVSGAFTTTGSPVDQGFICNASGNSCATIVDSLAGYDQGTFIESVNDFGSAVGVYRDSSGYSQYFIYNGGLTLNPIVDPLAQANQTYAFGINDSGVIAGTYLDTIGGNGHGFVYNGSSYTTVDVPGAFNTNITGINNNGWLSGYYNDGSGEHFFLYNGSTFMTIDEPSVSPGNCEGNALNDAGQILLNTGFLYSGGSLSSISNPAATGGTFACGISDAGVLAGWYFNSSADNFESFLATPTAAPEPSTAWLIAAGLAGIAFARTRRRADKRG